MDSRFRGNDGKWTHQFLVAVALLMGLSGATRADQIQAVVVGGKPRSIECYRIGSQLYMDVSQAAALYRAQVHWWPRSGKVLLSLHGRQVQFAQDSDKVTVGDKAVTLSQPVIIRTGRAFVPIDFFATQEFTDSSGFVSRFDPTAGTLNIDRKVSVGPLKWLSSADHTRIELALDSGVTYSIVRRGLSGIRVEIPDGRVDSFAQADVGNGIVQSLSLDQEPEDNPKVARLSVKLAPGIQFWKSLEEPSPRRLIIEVFKNKEAFDTAAPISTPVQVQPAQPLPVGPRPSIQPPIKPAKPLETAQPAQQIQIEMPPARRRYRIVIDPGHGGQDPGAKGVHGTLEKNINLRAALEFAELLRKSGNFDVLMTREDDTFIPLSQRSREANDFRADLFISLHCNASGNHREGGYEIYFLSEKASDPESQRVADVENAVLSLEGKSAEQEAAANLLQAMEKTEFINDASELAGLMSKSLKRRVDLTDRGVKQAAFYVLRGTETPAILIEMGFLTDSYDEVRLASRRFRHELLGGLYAGILDFARRHDWHLIKRS